MSKQKYGEPNGNGWQYYIDSYFAWLPTYCQGTFCWLQRVWVTWPEKPDGSLIYAADEMPDWFDHHPKTFNPEMYRTEFPYDPRESEK